MALAELAVELGIGPYIKLGKGEAAAGGSTQAVDPRRRDGGADRGDLPRSRARRRRLRLRRVADRRPRRGDRRTPRRARLQDDVAGAARRGRDGRRRCTTSPSRAPITRSASSPPCPWAGDVLGAGEGRSKRSAEQGAAAAATRTLATELVTERGGPTAATRGRRERGVPDTVPELPRSRPSGAGCSASSSVGGSRASRSAGSARCGARRARP